MKTIESHILMEKLQKATSNATNPDFAKGLLEAQRIVINMPDAKETTTICGYDMKNLILFAETCRKSGITNEDLWSFAMNAQTIVNVIKPMFHSDFVKSLAETLDKLEST